MQYRIPKELQRYVRISKTDGLVHSPDMPDELQGLFERTKEQYGEAIDNRQKEKEPLIL